MRTLLCFFFGLLAAIGVAAAATVPEQVREGRVKAILLRAQWLREQGRDWEAAQTDFTRALELDPDLIVVRQCVGKLKLESDKPAEAIEPLTRYLADKTGFWALTTSSCACA